MSTKYLSVLIWVKVHFIASFCEKGNTSSVRNNYYYRCAVFIRLILRHLWGSASSDERLVLTVLWNEVHVYLWTGWILPITMDGFFFGYYTPLWKKNKKSTLHFFKSPWICHRCVWHLCRMHSFIEEMKCWVLGFLMKSLHVFVNFTICILKWHKETFSEVPFIFLPSSGGLFETAGLNLTAA